MSESGGGQRALDWRRFDARREIQKSPTINIVPVDGDTEPRGIGGGPRR